MLACNRVRQVLSDLEIGGLGGRLLKKVETHLASCPDCDRELQAIRKIPALLQAVEQRDPPPGIWEGVIKRIRETEEIPGQPAWQRLRHFPGWPFTRRWVWPKRAAVLAAVAGAAVALGFTVLHKPPATPPADASAAEYIRAHAVISTQDPFADTVSLGSIAVVAGRADESM